ncbi:MAG: ABC transporter substrate-binding protein [Betaproteobacteria bacterium RIFCSPLOWO2_12_FULL_68_20]|nr:MAG: ABC transporter substrate-binding protein [Betaproteobacteria bacterium RIFCSPLOWO2_12_FULL_68_20]
MSRLTVVLLLSLSVGAAFAQAPQSGAGYPTKAIRLIVHFPPGGSTDTVSRIFAPVLAERLGKPVIVDNRPGGNGVIGAEIAAKSPPDGHTLFVASASVLVLNPILYQKIPYDPARDFAPITLLVTSPFIVATNPSLFPAASVRELIAAVKAKGQVAFASGGNGSAMHLAGELFRQLAGLDMFHVPYKGNGPAMTALAGGEVPIAFVDLGSTSALRKSGRVQVLAIAAAQRTTLAPEIPTAAESGLANWEALGWFGLVAPAGTPAEIIRRLSAEMTAILRMPEVRARIIATGAEPAPNTPAEFDSYIKSETGKWAKVIKQARIKVD